MRCLKKLQELPRSVDNAPMPLTPLQIVTRASRVYLKEQPSTSELNVLASRITQGIVSMNQQIVEISRSENRYLSDSDELARLFFILFDRAPDLPLFSEGMRLMEKNGMSLEVLADAGLNFGAGRLSTALKLTDKEFMQRLAEQMFEDPDAVLGLSKIVDNYATLLSAGALTRAQMVAMAARFDDASTKYYKNIDASLFYLASAGREASAAELTNAQGLAPIALNRGILVAAGEAPTLLLPFFSYSAGNLTIAGNFTEALQFNLGNLTSQLGTKSNYRAFFTLDNGASEGSVEISASAISGIRNIDASGIATGLASFTATASGLGSRLIAPNAPSSLTGATGNDTLTGGNRADSLVSGAGNDVLSGGAGADTLVSSQGRDTLTGGAGNDTFVLPVAELARTVEIYPTLTDFGNGTDVLNLAPLLGRTVAPEAVTPIVGNSDRTSTGFINLTGLVNNSVVLVTNTGSWVDTTGVGDSAIDLLPRTASQIAELFTERFDSNNDGVKNATRPITFAEKPITGQSYVVFSYDPVNGADIWLVDNFTSILSVTGAEVRAIGHLNPFADLWVTLTTEGSIIA